ncbi:MAG: hypothetical protein K0S07_1565, partial [Chlamydiales bacterium]|nr:hypothetical protein [Chlamydiales bacterium]
MSKGRKKRSGRRQISRQERRQAKCSRNEPAPFLPSVNGFSFANSFPPSLIYWKGIPVGNARYGLCGGMAFAALDYFQAHRRPPKSREPPQKGTSLLSYLKKRQL